MEKWRKILQKGCASPEEIAEKFHLDAGKLRAVAAQFPFFVNPYYFSLIREKGDGIYRQCIPDERELSGSADLMKDPLGEEAHTPAPCVVRRYEDRCLLLVSNRCAMYCRFCTRKRKFETPMCVDREKVLQGIEYIRKEPAIRDVLVTGGDPLLLEDSLLEEYLEKVHAIPHVDYIRIGSRVPCVLPQRITGKLLKMLKKYHPLYMNVHFNHPDEITEESARALRRLADGGIVLGSQTVLLKGVNDDPHVLQALMRRLLACRVRPYYLFHADLVFGTEHFRVSLKKGLELMDFLRNESSGMAVPHYAVDLPGGGGKVQLVPDHQVARNGKKVTFRNFCGELWDFPDTEE
ncbi:MAG: KamA family radical SAM protein [Lentisphaeria bacterium]|nr:KamA family radical SAM protein [Lentisphaeria bacterium]